MSQRFIKPTGCSEAETTACCLRAVKVVHLSTEMNIFNVFPVNKTFMCQEIWVPHIVAIFPYKSLIRCTCRQIRRKFVVPKCFLLSSEGIYMHEIHEILKSQEMLT